MNTTPQASGAVAQAAWVAYGISRRGPLAIQRGDRAEAGRRTTHVESARSTRRRRTPRCACLGRRTGRSAGWRELRGTDVRGDRYSQDDRVTSRPRSFAESYAEAHGTRSVR